MTCDVCQDPRIHYALDALEKAIPPASVPDEASDHYLIQLTRHLAMACVAEHERKGCENNSAGEACWAHRANVVAYIAHSLGFTPSMFVHQVAPVLAGYDGAHAHRHGKEG
ncbi:MAG: hypothetical protein ACRD1X_12505 [Vicinamibacteria bacterium]